MESPYDQLDWIDKIGDLISSCEDFEETNDPLDKQDQVHMHIQNILVF